MGALAATLLVAACDETSSTDPGSDSAVLGGDGSVGSLSDGSVVGGFDSGVVGSDSGLTGGSRDASVASDASTSPDASTGPDAGPGSTLKPKCMKKDSQLIVVGDSYINWLSHSFPEDIKKVSGQTWRMEAVGGTSMGSGGIGSIPQQFYDSIARDPDAHTVLMDGGGNDILVPALGRAFGTECTSKGAGAKKNCQDIVQLALDTAKKLMDDAAAKGIRDVVYFFYPHVPANTILSGDSPDEILDYALPKVRTLCADAVNVTKGQLRCTFIDLVPVFAGHKDWFNEDIHPNAKGSAAMADTIWKTMTEKCIGQKGPKDCCEM
jgi:GDSL-like Lipase/Acylhydrolase family